MPSVIVAEQPKTDGDVQISSGVSTTATERSERNQQLAAMLGVTLDDTTISSSPTPERPAELPLAAQSDEQIVEEMTRQGVMLPIPPKEEQELSLDEKIIETTPQITLPSHVEADVKTDSDIAPIPLLPAVSTVPNVEVTETDSMSQQASIKEKPATTSISPGTAVFVPKKAREQQKEREKEATMKPTSRKGARPGFGSRQLLRPPERTLHSSTDESDPEVAAFKRLARVGRAKEASPFTRRKPRRPERQLSSISEKSAEIAAEAALQNYPQDYSISAPNTTRSVTEWQRYVPKETFSGADASDNQTDVDIPRLVKRRAPSTKRAPPSKQEQEGQKKRKPQKHVPCKPVDSKQEVQVPRRLRPCQMPSTSGQMPSTSTALPKEPMKHVRRGILSSPEIPDVTLRRSLDRLDLLERSPLYNPTRGAMTSRSHISSRTRIRHSPDSDGRPYGGHGKKPRGMVDEPSWTSDGGGTTKTKPIPSHKELELPHSSRTVHHAVISRKIATRRHETHITKSTGDLSMEPRSSTSMSRRATTSRSADNLHNRPPWDSSPYKPDDKFKLSAESFLPQIKTTTKYYQKSRSVLNSPLGSHQRTSSKFSLTSLPPRCSSTLEFSPYFTPGADSDKPPKEDLWWGPAPRSFR
ncbi:hypothetical protein ANCCAN_00272 [Ancylostoma caninum]|uniref:Uncharacterized protein n=1 Tax=Ancylostoma caninum TaxID=29170 RepID=A0A368HDL7_ANCCA|nr:hypothetical protein ANCCAN_00272 [Ancylostoma caninum]